MTRARGVKVPNWECPNWTELPTIRTLLRLSLRRRRKKGKKKRRGRFIESPYPYKFTRRDDDDDDDDVIEGKKIASRKVSTARLLPYVSFTNAQTTRDPEKKKFN